MLAAAVLLPTLSGASVVRDNLYGVKAVSPTEAWAVGNFGTIVHTTNGGTTWTPSESHTKSPLFAVDFADATHGWIVGKDGVVLRTIDGGGTWTAQKSPVGPEKPLFKVKAIDADTAWIVGDWGAIGVTHDGGATWEDRSLAADVVLYDVTFPDATHGFITGEFGTLVATSDGGATWEKRNVGVEKTLFAVAFATPEKGWAVGIDGLILRTVDAGRSWTVQRGATEGGSVEDIGFQDTLKNPGFYGVQVRGQSGVVVGDTGTLLTTSDGGETWAQHELPEKQRLIWMRDVSLDAASHGFIVGARGFSAVIDHDQLVLAGAKATAPAR
jgi:photosystem II stability/assembly factor-like uncharacterized protein